jgi:hypothetical protein
MRHYLQLVHVVESYIASSPAELLGLSVVLFRSPLQDQHVIVTWCVMNNMHEILKAPSLQDKCWFTMMRHLSR